MCVPPTSNGSIIFYPVVNTDRARSREQELSDGPGNEMSIRDLYDNITFFVRYFFFSLLSLIFLNFLYIIVVYLFRFSFFLSLEISRRSSRLKRYVYYLDIEDSNKKQSILIK